MAKAKRVTVTLTLLEAEELLLVAGNGYGEYGDPRYMAPQVLRRMVAAGRLGRKTGRGFYEYD